MAAAADPVTNIMTVNKLLEYAVVVADADLQYIFWAPRQDNRLSVSKIFYELLDGYKRNLKEKSTICLLFAASPIQDGWQCHVTLKKLKTAVILQILSKQLVW